jgi:hypothetical protein
MGVTVLSAANYNLDYAVANYVVLVTLINIANKFAQAEHTIEHGKLV